MSTQKTVGIVGLGAMGGAVARRLLRSGFELAAFDLDSDAVEAIVTEGATATGLDRVFERDVVIISLPNDEAVEATCTSERLASLSGGVLVELSTITPAAIKRVGELGKAVGARVLDCPVSGGPDEAADGTLILLVGGEEEDIVAAAEVLEAFGVIERIGVLGDGKAIKLVNNTMSTGNMAVAVEAFVLGQKLGLSSAMMYDVIGRSGGSSYHFVKRTPYILEDDFAPRFAVRLCEKDLRITLETAQTADYPMPIAASIRRVYASAMDQGLADEDMAAIVKIFDGRAEQYGG